MQVRCWTYVGPMQVQCRLEGRRGCPNDGTKMHDEESRITSGGTTKKGKDTPQPPLRGGEKERRWREQRRGSGGESGDRKTGEVGRADVGIKFRRNERRNKLIFDHTKNTKIKENKGKMRAHLRMWKKICTFVRFL